MEQSYSWWKSCSSRDTPFDISALKDDFREKVFGQHIAEEIIMKALSSHIKNLEKSKKPLVMSFQGLPGIGKNYVADMIVKRFYRLGDDSQYVNKWRGRIDFPLESKVSQYQVRIHSLNRECN